MTNIEQLIQTLCPNGVPWKTLGEVCDFKRGSTITANQTEDGCIPVIAGGQKPAYYHNQSNREGKNITVAGSGAYAGYVAYWELPIFVSDAFTVTPKDSSLNIKYLYYFLTSIQDKIYHTKKGSGVPHVHPSSISSFEIPLPPLEIQNRIVEILDRFSALAAELQAELQLRRKQYEYYRTRLLTPHSESDSTDNTDVATSSSWQWKTLGEIGIFQRGNGLQKKDFTEEGVGCIHYGQIYTRLGTFCNETITRVPKELAEKLVKVYKGNLVIACTSENVEDCCKAVAWLGDETIVTGGHSAVFRHNENPKYIAYAFQSEIFQKQKNKFAKGVKVIDIKIEELAKIKIPLPSLSEQARIVSILDKFEALTTSLSDGIPAEQQAQQKRYEYYRDLLLNFNNNAPKVPNAPRDPKDPKDPKATKI